MKKFRIPLIAICFLLFAVSGYTADLFHAGKSGDNNLYVITSTAVVEGQRGDYEVVDTSTTTDTLTAIESGKTFIAVADCALTLPSAALGLTYTFTTEGEETARTTVADRTDYIIIDPVAADTIRGIDGQTLSAGDRLKSQGKTGDSITIICGAANTWYVSAINGTWTDYN